jgi:hypothetical protein
MVRSIFLEVCWMARMEIKNGPSEMRLMMSLFRQAEGGNPTYFTVGPEVPGPKILPVEIDLLERVRNGQGACDLWRFEGSVLEMSLRMRVVGYVQGVLNTSTREGWLTYENNRNFEELLTTWKNFS